MTEDEIKLAEAAGWSADADDANLAVVARLAADFAVLRNLFDLNPAMLAARIERAEAERDRLIAEVERLRVELDAVKQHRDMCNDALKNLIAEVRAEADRRAREWPGVPMDFELRLRAIADRGGRES